MQTSQNSLNTTAHNLSNEGTTGYVRQQVLQSDTIYNTSKAATPKTSAQQVGIGTVYKKVRQVRDYFLDQSYRRESGRSAFYDASYSAINEVEDLLDELDDDASFNKALSNFWSSLEELQKTPDDTVVQRLLVQNAQSLLTNASQVYQGLVDYQNETNLQIKDMVRDINNLGHTIYDLNLAIQKIEAGGIETANDLRDQRNHALDELAQMVNMTYDEDGVGAVRVSVEGVDFVVTDTVYEMNVVQDTTTGFYTPYWEMNSYKVRSAGEDVYTDEDGDLINISKARVFNLTQEISSEKNTDVGKLRAALYIRGDKNANYTDIPVKPEIPDKDKFTDPAEYEEAVKRYYTDMERYDADTVYYNQTVAQSVCMNTEAEFDQLIHNIVTTVNGILEDIADPVTGYMCDYDGYPLQLFQKISSDGYVADPATGKYYTEDPVTGEISWNYMPEGSAQDKNKLYYQTDNDGNALYDADGKMLWNKAAESSYYTETLYSITNLQINPTLVREAGKLGFVRPDGTVDYDAAKAFVDAFDADVYTLNPNVTTKCSINTYYSSLVSQVANTGSAYKNIAESQQNTVDSIAYSREQVQGVSSDEELTNMIKYQNAYNAASRYINVLNEMLEQLLSQLT